MIVKRQKVYSEAGQKKLAERAKKKANKRKWQTGTPYRSNLEIETASISARKAINSGVLRVKAAKKTKLAQEYKNPDLVKKYTKEAKELLDKADKISSISTTLDDAAVLRGRNNRYNNDPLLIKKILQEKNPANFKEMREAARNRMVIRKIKERSKAIAKAKRNKKIILGVTAGTLATAGTIAGVKAIKKKKSDKKK